MALPGVRVGPLDPDRAENFGQVSGRTSARQLIRHHQALHPPALLQALTPARHGDRSDALLYAEVEEAARKVIEDAGDTVPDGFTVVGAAVHGNDDQPGQQIVTYVYRVESGRTGKGFIESPRDVLPESFDAGDEAVAIADARKRGMPWLPAAALRSAGRIGRSERADDPDGAGEREHVDSEVEGLHDELAELREERDEAVEQRDALAEQLSELSDRLASLEAAAATPPAAGGEEPSPQTTEGAPAQPGSEPEGSGGSQGESEGEPATGADPAVPWDGYENARAQDIVSRLRANRDADEAGRVAAFESANGKRGTVLGAANEILDRPPAS